MLKRSLVFISILIAILVLAACNYPMQPVTVTEPTVDMTLTALFAQLQPTTAVPAETQAAANTPAAVNTPLPTNTVVLNTPVPTTTPVPPTVTPVPATLTYTPVPGRPGPYVNSYYLSTAPVLDGDWGDWKAKAKEYPTGNIVYGRGNWTGEADLDASYMLGWDSNYLYIGVKVKDDTYVQNASGQDLFKGDSIEIMVDTNLNGDWYTQSMSPDDYQLGISPGNPTTTGTREAYLWMPSATAGSRSQVTVSSVGESGVYRVEFAVPWSTLGVTPVSGLQLGFVISVSDNDNSSANEQQTMVSNDSYRRLADPTTWGVMTLR